MCIAEGPTLSMNSILIIGGSYFAGRILVEERLATKNYQVFVFNRGHVPLKMKGVVELVGDRLNSQQIKVVIPDKDWHGVVDFCAYDPGDISRLIRFLPGTVRHYILISTTSVYVPFQDSPVGEDFPKLSGPQPELGEFADYGFNKWLAECELVKECSVLDIPPDIPSSRNHLRSLQLCTPGVQVFRCDGSK